MTGLVCPNCDGAFDTDKRVVRADVTECKLCHKKFVVTQKTLSGYHQAAKQAPSAAPEPTPSQNNSQSYSQINCPHCAAVLQGQITQGQIVECSDCHKQFEATPERLNAPTVLARAAPSPERPKRKSKAGVLALVFIGLIVLFATLMPDSPPPTTNANTPNIRATPVQPQRDPNDIRNFLSSWDGSNRELVALVKSAMHDPKSFEHVETRFIDRGRSLKLIMTYRGKNAFNATVTNKISAELDKSTRQLSNVEQL